jgi:hypothetical protein
MPGRAEGKVMISLARKHIVLGMYPFLLNEEGSWFFNQEPDSINTERCLSNPEAVLKHKPYQNSYEWSGGGHHSYVKYFSVRTSTEEGWKINQFDSAGESGTGSGDRQEWDCPPIGDQLLTNGWNPEFIIRVEYNDTDDNGRGTPTCNVTIFPMGKVNVESWFREELRKAYEALLDEGA